MRNAISPSALVLLATAAACEVSMPPPPDLVVASPHRGMVQSDAGRVMVTGTALPGPTGDPVASVRVNNVPATLAADGSFSALVDVPAGVMLLETVATSAQGASATDARAVQVGQLRPIGTGIDRAVTAALSADAFAKLAAAAGPLIKGTDFTTLLAPLQPMANLGDSYANVKLSINRLTLGDVAITMVPVDGGLTFSADLTNMNLAATAVYSGYLVPNGSTTIGVTADRITIGATLVVQPNGTDGFTTKLASPSVRTTNLKLQASGLAGSILDLLNDNLASTVQSIITSSSERALQPMINAALGALAGPQHVDVVGKRLELQASPSAVTFTRAGALVTMNVLAKLEGSETSRGYIFTPNGTPAITVGDGIQLGLADDLINQLLAQVHALGLLNINLARDFGVFDNASFKLAIPPMISANTGDGSLRLVLGDMIASFTNDGTPVINAAVNAQVDLEILRGNTAQEIALKFGKVHVHVNVLDAAAMGDGVDATDVSSAAGAGLGVQLDSLSQFLITVPVPAVAGVSFDTLSLRADSGYVLVSGQIH